MNLRLLGPALALVLAACSPGATNAASGGGTSCANGSIAFTRAACAACLAANCDDVAVPCLGQAWRFGSYAGGACQAEIECECGCAAGSSCASQCASLVTSACAACSGELQRCEVAACYDACSGAGGAAGSGGGPSCRPTGDPCNFASDCCSFSCVQGTCG